MKERRLPSYVVAEVVRLSVQKHLSPSILKRRVIRYFARTDPKLTENDRWQTALLLVETPTANPTNVSVPPVDPPAPAPATSSPSARGLTPSEIVQEVDADPWFGTEFGLTARFVVAHHSDARYALAEGKWRFKTGSIWPTDDHDRGKTAMQLIVVALHQQSDTCVAECDTERARDQNHEAKFQKYLASADDGPCCDFRRVANALTKWAHRCASERYVGGALAGARTWRASDGSTLEVTPSQLDADPMALPVRDGVIDLRTCTKRPYRDDEYWSWQSPYTYDPMAPHKEWDGFLERLGSFEKVEYLQRLAYYVLTGDTSQQQFFNVWGKGSNGKTTFFETLAGLIPGAVGRPDPLTFMDRGIDRVPCDLARLRPARLVLISEAGGRASTLAEETVRRWTGGEAISARYLFQPYFDYVPQGKLIFYSSDKLRVKGQSTATWRRLVHITFNAEFPSPGQPGNIPEYHRRLLQREGDGILTWALGGRLGYEQRQLVPPPEVHEETAGFRSEADPLGEFLRECVVYPSAKSFVATRDLRRCLHEWALREGDQTLADWSPRRLAQELLDRGWSKSRSSVERGWQDVDLSNSGARLIGRVRPQVLPP